MPPKACTAPKAPSNDNTKRVTRLKTELSTLFAKRIPTPPPIAAAGRKISACLRFVTEVTPVPIKEGIAIRVKVRKKADRFALNEPFSVSVAVR